MKKTSLYLEPDVDSALGRLAEVEGVPKAAFIRRVLAAAVGRTPRPRLTAIGVGHGPGNVADNVDLALWETRFGR